MKIENGAEVIIMYTLQINIFLILSTKKLRFKMTCSSKTREEYSVLQRNILTYDKCSVVHGIFYCFQTKIKNVMLSSHGIKFLYEFISRSILHSLPMDDVSTICSAYSNE